MDIGQQETSHQNSSVFYLSGTVQAYDFGDCVRYCPGGKGEEDERSVDDTNKDLSDFNKDNDSDESVYHQTSDQDADVGFDEVPDLSSQETYYVECEEIYHVRAGSDSIYQTDDERSSSRDEEKCQQLSSLSQETDAFYSAEEEWSKSHDDVSRLIAGLSLSASPTQEIFQEIVPAQVDNQEKSYSPENSAQKIVQENLHDDMSKHGRTQYLDFSPELQEQEIFQEIVPVPHKLQHSYTFWYSTRISKRKVNHNYNQNLHRIGSFDTVEGFWLLYSHLKRPDDLNTQLKDGFYHDISDIHLFKTGIKPLWEDPSNYGGGKVMVRLKKGSSSLPWENLLLGMVGEQFMVSWGDQICGVVISMRPKEDILSLWNQSSSDLRFTNQIRDQFCKVLDLYTEGAEATVIEYKAHCASIKDKTSYTNTDVSLKFWR